MNRKANNLFKIDKKEQAPVMTEGSSIANENYFKASGGAKKMVRCNSRASIGSHQSSVQSSRGDVIDICDEELENEI